MCANDKGLNASAVFDQLQPARAREVRTRFDHWIDAAQPNDKWFHGWPGHPRYGGCFTFKWKENRTNHRFYGFLCHPPLISDASFHLCVLVYHATKNERETDESELDRVCALRAQANVIAAIGEIYHDAKGEG